MNGSNQRQLPLPVQLRDEATLDNFLPLPASRALIAALRAQIGGDGEPIIYLHGPTGVGKTHLLQASCHLVGVGAVYLPLGEVADCLPDEVLQGMETLKLVCLDDVDRVMGRADWELALFNLINRARQQGCRLLVAGSAAPRVLAVDLPDLRSRLGWGIVYQLAAANDEVKTAILQFRAGRRGLVLGDEVCAYLVARAPRDMDALLAVLDTLDRASLVEKRALSIPFVKSVLGW
ncbi:MAG: DnaA regulatory inactivator Hda [Halieaceae bacterium]|nr:DnaA regulatory inactivator Hda [Halieaceae bacterium]